MTKLIALLGLLVLTTALPAHAKVSSKGKYKGLLHFMSFEEEYFRYPTPDEIIEHMRTVFPKAKFEQVGSNCLMLTPENKAILGDSNPATGVPTLKKPNGAFVNWYADCTSRLIQANGVSRLSYGISDMALWKAELHEFMGEPLYSACLNQKNVVSSPAADEPQKVVIACKWRDFDPETKVQAALYQIEQLIGPDDVVKDLGIAQDSRDLARMIIETADAFDANPDDKLKFLNVQAEPLRVLDSVQLIQFLTLMTESFKY